MFEVTPHHIWFISFHNTESWWLLMFSSLLVKRWRQLSYILPINAHQLQSNRLNKCKTTKYFFNFPYPDVAMVSDGASESYVVCFDKCWHRLVHLSKIVIRHIFQLLQYLYSMYKSTSPKNYPIFVSICQRRLITIIAENGWCSFL